MSHTCQYCGKHFLFKIDVELHNRIECKEPTTETEKLKLQNRILKYHLRQLKTDLEWSLFCLEDIIKKSESYSLEPTDYISDME